MIDEQIEELLENVAEHEHEAEHRDGKERRGEDLFSDVAVEQLHAGGR